MEVSKRLIRKKKSKEDEQTLAAELSLAHRLSYAKCQLVQSSYIS